MTGLTPAAEAAMLAEMVIGDRFFWSLSRGRAVPHEPLWCFTVWDADEIQGAATAESLTARAMALDDDPLRAVKDVLADIGLMTRKAN